MEQSSELIGWAYLILATREFSSEELTDTVKAICRMEDIRLFMTMEYDRVNKGSSLIELFPIFIEESFCYAIRYFCNNGVDHNRIHKDICDAVAMGLIDVVKILIEYGSFCRSEKIMLLENAILSRNRVMVEFVFNLPCLSEFICNIRPTNISIIMEENRVDIIGILLSYPIPDITWKHIKDKAISRGKGDIVQMILHSKNVDFNNYDVQSCVCHQNIIALKCILDHPSYKTRDSDINVLRSAILGYNEPAVRIMMSHPKIRKELLEKRYQRMAKNILN